MSASGGARMMADLAVAGGRLGAAPGWGARLRVGLRDALAAEGERRLLWLPVAFGAGYCGLFRSPLRAAIVARVARRQRLRRSGVGVAAAPGRRRGGVAACRLRRRLRADARDDARARRPVALPRRLGPAAFTGRVVDSDLAEKGWRLVIAPDALPGLATSAVPQRVRVHVPASSDADLAPRRGHVNPEGDAVPAVRRRPCRAAAKFPAPELYFAGIGAVGYSYGAGDASSPTRRRSGGDWHEWLRHLRSAMTQRIASVLPGSTGGVASALITGKRGAIAEEVKQAFREFRAVASAGDRRPASGTRRRLCVLCRARRPGA